jgi:AcrR family transcriptional regulator
VNVKRRREENAEATRNAVLEAALERFAADGFDGASIDAIAEDARVTKGAVYHHFRDKAELFEAVFVLLEERLVEHSVAAVMRHTDPWEQMSAGIDAYLRECCEPEFRRVALQEAPRALGWARWREIEERYFLGTFQASLDAMVANGLIEVPPGEMTARVVMAASTEAGFVVAEARHPNAARKRAHALVMRILEGLRPAR